MNPSRTAIFVPAVLASALLFAGCGSSSTDDEEGSGKVTLTLAGKATSGPSGVCYFAKPGMAIDPGRKLALYNDVVQVLMPSDPGDFDAASVLIHDSGQALFGNNHKGTWSRDGDHATGHLEGQASPVSGGAATAYSIDFDCPIGPAPEGAAQ